MKDIFVYNDEFGNECTFLRKQYYFHVCNLVTDFFEEPLEMNSFHKYFIKMLDELEDYKDVYVITIEPLSYWAICIIENDFTINSLINEKKIEELTEWNLMYYKSHNIVRYIIQGINEETYVFTDKDGEKKIFFRKKYHEFVAALVKYFFRQHIKFNNIEALLISYLNGLPNSGDYKNINEITDNSPYYWAMSIIENEWTTKTLNKEELEKYYIFEKEFYKQNDISSFIYPA